jgi:hypothetical protein
MPSSPSSMPSVIPHGLKQSNRVTDAATGCPKWRGMSTRDDLLSLFGKLDLKQLNVAWRSLRILIWEFEHAVGLPEPYYLVPDNSLLQDIKHKSKNGERLARYVGIQSFAYFLRNYTRLDVRLVITPAIFFESIGRRELKSETEYRDALRQIYNDLSQLGIPVMVLGIQSYKKGS